MTISIERTILNTTFNGLQVIKTVEETKLPLKNSQEFCIGVKVASEVMGDKWQSPMHAGLPVFDGMSFFGKTYEEANAEYLEWLDKVVSDDDATYNKARGVQCLLNELKTDY